MTAYTFNSQVVEVGLETMEPVGCSLCGPILRVGPLLYHRALGKRLLGNRMFMGFPSVIQIILN